MSGRERRPCGWGSWAFLGARDAVAWVCGKSATDVVDGEPQSAGHIAACDFHSQLGAALLTSPSPSYYDQCMLNTTTTTRRDTGREQLVNEY